MIDSIIHGLFVPVFAFFVALLVGAVVYWIGVTYLDESSVYAAGIAALLSYTAVLYQGWKYTA